MLQFDPVSCDRSPIRSGSTSAHGLLRFERRPVRSQSCDLVRRGARRRACLDGARDRLYRALGLLARELSLQQRARGGDSIQVAQQDVQEADKQRRVGAQKGADGRRSSA